MEKEQNEVNSKPTPLLKCCWCTLFSHNAKHNEKATRSWKNLDCVLVRQFTTFRDPEKQKKKIIRKMFFFSSLWSLISGDLHLFTSFIIYIIV